MTDKASGLISLVGFLRNVLSPLQAQTLGRLWEEKKREDMAVKLIG